MVPLSARLPGSPRVPAAVCDVRRAEFACWKSAQVLANPRPVQAAAPGQVRQLLSSVRPALTEHPTQIGTIYDVGPVMTALYTRRGR